MARVRASDGPFQQGWIHGVGDGIDIDEYGARADCGDGLGGGDEGVRDGDDLVAGLDIEREKSEMQRCCPVRESDTVAGTDVSGEGLFKLFDFGSEHKG